MGKSITNRGSKVTVGAKQTIEDLAIQCYGDVSGVFLLMKDNPKTITSVDAVLTVGMKLFVKSDPINSNVVAYYSQRNYRVVSGA